ncbi:hypothetical protein FB45DRAFT_1023539 [Roridomyces roridus]|uniref:F-box domain-containing protein n=1 Tax=Roridomyces roridus TaxID=1738132 RepID=A0AAD7FUL8_9AGAR|nr:hypothetical protein FB45DRAFT_1023539 [Roridomyces roridus]
MDSLPPELIEAVFHVLDARHIVRLATVSRKFHGIFQRSSALQYKIQLERDGLRDGNTPPSAAARLEILNTYRAAWANFQPVSTIVKMEGNLWELVGNVLATYGTETFSFNRVSSPTKGIPSVTWSTKVPFTVADFSFDVSQDLLLAVEVNGESNVSVRLLSLETGRPHSLAKDPCLSTGVCIPTTGFPPSFQIRIFGEYVGVMLDDIETMFLFVWKWKSGTLKKHISDDAMTSFAFLNDRMLLVTAHTPLWTSPPELRVVGIEGDAPDMCFHLPDLALQETEVDMMIQTEPEPCPEQPNVPFSTSHTDRLFVVSLRGWESGYATEPTFMLCFLLSTLVNHMENPEIGRICRWDTWGPTGTRMLRVPRLPEPWVCFVYGQRCVLHTSRTRCKILDFNPLSPSQERYTYEKIVDKKHRMFLNSVKTSLHFTYLDVDITPSEAVMLTEDGIITVSPEEDIFTILSV